MNNKKKEEKKKEEKKKEEIKKQFLRAVTKESDGTLSKDQWTRVLLDARINKST